MSLFEQEYESGAKFSDCGKYRYALWRTWDKSKPKIMFIGLNPSTATDKLDDPTIRRVVGFAKLWGYVGVYMANLFAIISPDPNVLLTCNDPIADNDIHLSMYSVLCKDILFAWGSFKQAKDRAKTISAMFPEATCLGTTKDGSPKHPLYIAAKTKQTPFNPSTKEI